jgi:hypothetical protein
MQDETNDDFDAMATAGARVLGLSIEPEWRPAILANLRVSLTLGLLVAEFDLPDAAEPAAVFRA